MFIFNISEEASCCRSVGVSSFAITSVLKTTTKIDFKENTFSLFLNCHFVLIVILWWFLTVVY